MIVDDDGEVSGEMFAVEANEFRTGAEVGHPEVVGEWGFEGFLRARALLVGGV